MSESESESESESGVPLLDVNAQNGPLMPELRAAFERVMGHGQFILGKEVETFEKACAELIGVPHAIGVSSGTDALLVALMALGIGPGDEVVTSTYSFFATGGCVARVGATPVFVDIDPATFNLDPSKLEAAVTPRTRAIMTVHLFGQPCAPAAVRAVAERHRLPVLEDAAQAILAREVGGGSDRDGRPVGALGAIGCFSFFPSKNVGGFGDAGLVTTTDAALADKVRILRAHGGKPKYHHAVIGGNFRLDALQAALLAVKLPHARAWTDARRANSHLYTRLFTAAGVDLRLPAEVERGHVWNQYTIRTPRRDALRAHLTAKKIGTETYYPVPLHLQKCFAHLGYAEGSLPEAETAAKESLSLPIFPELGEARLRRVVDVVVDFLQRSSA